MSALGILPGRSTDPRLVKRRRVKWTILLGQHDRQDEALIRRALGKIGIDDQLFVARDGGEVISYIVGEGKFADRVQYPFPDVVLLSTKLPGLSGPSVLCWLRSQPQWEKLPVLLLRSGSSSGHAETLARLNAGSIERPADSTAVVDAIERSIRRSDPVGDAPMPLDALERELLPS